MTDWTKASDAEVNRAVAEAMGWTEIHSREELAQPNPNSVLFWVEEDRVKFVEDNETWRIFDPLHDWRAFGRLWEWCEEMEYNGHCILEEMFKSYSSSMDRPVVRRALALAFLQAVIE